MLRSGGFKGAQAPLASLIIYHFIDTSLLLVYLKPSGATLGSCKLLHQNFNFSLSLGAEMQKIVSHEY